MNIAELSVQLKKQTLESMTQLEGFVKMNPALGLPAPGVSFTLAKSLLEKGEFNLVVCGKVKSGKSSLINALLGRELLPVCTDVATSCVFRISNAPEDSFEVVYGNGDREKITEEQLTAFGSQAEIDKNNGLSADKAIAYIQVNTKAPFLPQGVSIIDTPGVGSTYPHHTQITLQYMQQADAALFVMKPEPIGKVEIDFLTELVKVTPNLMFVTTHIDQKGQENVKDAVQRNTELIKQNIGNQLYGSVKILCMSSTQLMKSAQADNDAYAKAYLFASKYEDVKAEMQRIILLTQGYYRTGQAYNEALSYYNLVMGHLKKRLEMINANAEKRKELETTLKEAQTSLEALGKARQAEILLSVDKVLNALQYSFQDLKSSDSKLIRKFDKQIDSLANDAELKNYSETLSAELCSDLQQEWKKLTQLVEKEVNALLTDYSDKCGKVLPNDFLPATVNEGGLQIEQLTVRNRLNHMRNEMMMGTTIVIAGQYLGLIAIPVIGQIIGLAAAGFVLAGLFNGQARAKAQLLAKNKDALKRYVRDAVADFYKQYTELSLADGQYESFMTGYRNSIHNYAADSMNAIYKQADDQIKGLQKSIQDLQKEGSAILINGLIDKWKAKGQNLIQVQALLTEVRSQLPKD